MTSRQARVKVDKDKSGVYHLCSRVAGPKRLVPTRRGDKSAEIA